MTVIGVLTVGPAAPADFGVTMAGAAVGRQLGLLPARGRKKSKRADPVTLSACRTVYVEASPQGGSIRTIFGLAVPEQGPGLQSFASQAVDPAVNGSLDWRASAQQLPGGTPFLDCPSDPAKSALLLANSGPATIRRLAMSPDLAVVDFGEPYYGSPALECLQFASFILVVTTAARPVLARAANHVTSLLEDRVQAGKLAFVIRGDAVDAKPDGAGLQQLLPAPVSLVVPHDPKAAIGSVRRDRTRESSTAVRAIRSYTTKLMENNSSIGGLVWN